MVSLVYLSKKVEENKINKNNTISDKLIDNRSNIELTFYNEEEIKEIIFGSLLGDGKLEKSIRSKNARFGLIQSIKFKEFFIALYRILSDFCSTNYHEYTYLDSRTNKKYISLNF